MHHCKSRSFAQYTFQYELLTKTKTLHIRHSSALFKETVPRLCTDSLLMDCGLEVKTDTLTECQLQSDVEFVKRLKEITAFLYTNYIVTYYCSMSRLPY
jgi:hypothetical protein